MRYFKRNHHPSSVTQKVLAGFVLVFISILFALGITHFGFREMMETVDQLSAPNAELNALNSLFHEITAFDQLQREQAITNKTNPYKTFLTQSSSLVNKIDSLRLMDWDSTQQMKLMETKQILQKRNKLFFSYLKLKSELGDNQMLTTRLDTLSRILVNEKIIVDTSVVTTEKKTTTTYTRDSVPVDDRSKIAKFFSKKKKTPPPTTHIKVQQELSVMVDTLSIARQNKALEEVEKIILDLENDQKAENKRLFHEELELIHANSILLNQLLGILHEVEKEELLQISIKNEDAVALVTTSIRRITILLLVFFVGAALLVYLIWIDISRSNYYKAQLEKAKNEAEELGVIKERFLANMSHEIRTPLQSIVGFAEQLKHGQGIDQEAVSAINSSSEHLLHIVDEVLDYSRISSGRFVFGKENFNLIPLVKEVEAAVRIQAERKDLTLLLDTEQADHPTLSGDPFRLRQILYNLLGNAIKFTASGHVKLSIKTNATNGSVQCEFMVSDTGIGIRKEDQEKIFSQFEQADARIAGQHGGTGLGLSIVKSLVEAQGGSIRVSSEPGMGACFTVTLDYEKATAESDVQIQRNNPGSDRFKGKVIVVDDDATILRLCSFILKKNNIPFYAFNNPRVLMDEVPDPEISHILIDIRMPEVNGIELCKILRPRYPDTTQFIAVTAHVFPQDQKQLIEAGFDAVMAKPFREKELVGLFGILPSSRDESDDQQDLDVSTLRQMTLGDESLFQSILSSFIEETENDLQQLEIALGEKKAEAIREIIHKLAGRIGQIGVHSVCDQLRQIENGLAENNPLNDLMEHILLAKEGVQSLLIKFRLYPIQTSR